MAKRVQYDVLHHERGGWEVRRRGAATPAAVESTKKAVVRRAAEIARSQQPSQVIIRKMDGTIQEERTYGADPRRTEG